MSQYRIVHNGTAWRVQRRLLWFWVAAATYPYDTRYDTYPAAQRRMQALEDHDAAERGPWRPVP